MKNIETEHEMMRLTLVKIRDLLANHRNKPNLTFNPVIEALQEIDSTLNKLVDAALSLT